MMVPFSCMAGIAWTSLQFWYSCNSGVVELHVLVGQRWCRPASGSHTVSSSASLRVTDNFSLRRFWASVVQSASLRVTDSVGDSWASSEPWRDHNFNVLALGLGVASVGHESQEQCVDFEYKIRNGHRIASS